MKLFYLCNPLKRSLALLALLCAIAKPTIAEELLSAIKGKVITSDGLPAPYVTIRIEKSNHGALTDVNGDFVIKRVKPGNYTLVVSLVGYEKVLQEVTVETDKIARVTIRLGASGQQMKEVTVVGEYSKYTVLTPSNSLRLNTPLVEIPQSIAEVSREVLADQQIYNMHEGVTRNVSGASRQGHWDMYSNIQVRGSRASALRNGMNVYISSWSPLTEDMSMVDRIEFIKGPAGFMMSNGEPGGMYNVVTKKPTGADQGEVTLSLGSFDNYRATLDLDGKLSKNGKLLYRLNLAGELKNGWRDFDYTNRYSISPVLKYLVDEKNTLTLEYNLQYMQLPVIGGNYSFSKRGYGDLPVNFTTIEGNMDPTRIHDNSVMAFYEHRFNQDWKLTAQFGFFHYKQTGQSMWPKGFSTPGNDSLLQRGMNIWDALGLNKTAQVFLNGTFHTGALVHNILGGVDMKYSNYYADWSQAANFGDSTFNIYQPKHTSIIQPRWDRTADIRTRGVQYNYGYSAVYLQDQIGFFQDRLRVTLAGRYTTNQVVSPYDGTNKDSKFTPRFGVSYSFDSNSSVYGVYDVSFIQNPGLDWQQKPFDAMTGDNIEFGIKRNWFNSRFTSTLAVYRIMKNNVLTTDLEHLDRVSGQPVYSRQNGQQRIKGLEVDLQGEPVKGLNLVVNYAYTDGIVSKDAKAELVGNYVPGIAKHTQNSWVTYTLGKGLLKGLRANAGYQYQGGRVAGQVYDKSENFLPDYFRIDAGLGYSIHKFNVNVLVNNVLNKYLYTGGPGTDNYNNKIYYWQTEPGRNVRLSMGYRF
ncbi:TonB-dependent receptor [Chitinophaga qingshengii]|uniref:TonB-dependent receptor n=1 Tax=Chitinophaga qingshengii TaxID=1569794 RepID=A0ABR7TI96_9BACT|nr:TonB-dependent receptor [Chitinophaga qingshengii]MBC9929231.1 TonB-dependent receptor [Chitinophaga qingshengii]